MPRTRGKVVTLPPAREGAIQAHKPPLRTYPSNCEKSLKVKTARAWMSIDFFDSRGKNAMPVDLFSS